MAPTVTVKAAGINPTDTTCSKHASKKAITWRDRIVRPLTEDEENYELMRAKKNAGSNLLFKGKHRVQVNRRSESRPESYDSY
jgi:hypothetical protein